MSSHSQEATSSTTKIQKRLRLQSENIMPSSKKLKVESTSTEVVSPYKPGALSLWLQTSSSLGGVEPVDPPVKSGEGEGEDEDDDDEDDDEDDDDASEDERLLQLRRLEDGTDWMALYEKIMREGDGEGEKDDDDEEDDDEYDEGVKKPSLNKKNEKKPMAVKKAAQAAAKAGAPHTTAAKAGALHTTAPSAAIRAGGVAPQSDAAANVAILPRNSSTSLQKKQQQSAPSLLQPTLAVEKKAAATRTTEESTSLSSSSLSFSHGGAGGAKRARSADETATEKKEKRELPKPFVPSNPAGCVFLSNIPEGTPPDEISKLLSSSFGKVRTVHYEKSNQGKDCSFGYVEFESQTSVKAAVASTATAPSLNGRTLKLDLFTPESNYRNADGSRRRNKKENKKKEKMVEQQASETGVKKARGVKTTK